MKKIIPLLQLASAIGLLVPFNLLAGPLHTQEVLQSSTEKDSEHPGPETGTHIIKETNKVTGKQTYTEVQTHKYPTESGTQVIKKKKNLSTSEAENKMDDMIHKGLEDPSRYKIHNKALENAIDKVLE